MNPNHYVAIMAGGVGSRFWPASLEEKPKQFLDIMGTGESLLQMTFNRFKTIIPLENIFIVTNAAYVGHIHDQLPELESHQILSEPSRNNTAPCIAYMALKLKKINPEAVFAVAPSDHLISKSKVFIETIEKAFDFCANHDALMTLGITPTYPNTGYGYIQFNELNAVSKGIYKVDAFKEKPDLEKAKTFLAAGHYLWNGGIFVWSVKKLIASFEKNAPDILDVLEKGNDVYNTPKEQNFIDTYYPTTPNISIDYAIMEKADNIYTIPCDCGWTDLGTWASLFMESEKDGNNNALQGNKIYISETTNSIIRVPKNKTVVVHGLNDFIIVDENDVLLIYPISKEQEIKQISQKVKNDEQTMSRKK